MKKPAKPDAALVGDVPNNPRYDRVYSARKGMDARAIKDAEDNTLYDTKQLVKDKISKRLQEVYGSRMTRSGNLVPRDEPTEPQKTQHLKVDKKQYDKDMQFWKSRNRTAVAQNRLKKRGDEYIPKKSGKKMFEDFMRNAKEATNQRRKDIDDTDLRNIFNAAQHLSYEKWIWFVNDEYSSRF
jgi:hypothetical protein